MIGPPEWYDRRDSVYIEFCVADSKDVKINFEEAKFVFSCLGGTDQVKHENEVDLFEAIDQNESIHKRTDRSVLCCLRKAEPGKAWPRLTKEKAKLTWLSVDFNNWKDWEGDSDEEQGNFDNFPEGGDGDMAFNTQEAMAKMMNNMGGEDCLPDLDDVDDVRASLWSSFFPSVSLYLALYKNMSHSSHVPLVYGFANE
uniref:Prostaglandin E synthase 3 n=1 Tax=Hucho hucho TaxID=62062 RepID=A0A4W5P514_9TELE